MINKHNPAVSDNGEPAPDPSIRQEFPGAASTKKKIEAGKRNAKTENNKSGNKVRPEDDVPKSDAEPLQPESKS